MLNQQNPAERLAIAAEESWRRQGEEYVDDITVVLVDLQHRDGNGQTPFSTPSHTPTKGYVSQGEKAGRCLRANSGVSDASLRTPRSSMTHHSDDSAESFDDIWCDAMDEFHLKPAEDPPLHSAL